MDLKLLLELKKQVISAENLSDPWEFFYDHFADHQEFLDIGSKVKNPKLKAIIRAICKNVFNKHINVTNLLLIELEDYDFTHGPCFVEGCLVSVIYFEDIDKGLLAIANRPDTPETLFIRFSISQLDSGGAYIPGL